LGERFVIFICKTALPFEWIDPMDTDPSRIETTTDLARAGFWRRWLATLIDILIVTLPFQALAAVLFAMTAGTVQMNNGLFRVCAPAHIPSILTPAPPHDSNFAQGCRVSFFGAQIGATVTVGRFTREGNKTTTVSQTYMVDKNGNQIQGRSIDGIVALALLLYLIGMIWKTGRTLGDRAVAIKVIDTAKPDASTVALGKAIIRYPAMLIGAVPAFGLLTYQSFATSGSADAIFPANFFQWFAYAGVLGALWAIVLIIQIARKTDPVYDRLAGTAVVRAPGRP
jgi:uncharacterized RDD family membrane protein YckC